MLLTLVNPRTFKNMPSSLFFRLFLHQYSLRTRHRTPWLCAESLPCALERALRLEAWGLFLSFRWMGWLCFVHDMWKLKLGLTAHWTPDRFVLLLFIECLWAFISDPRLKAPSPSVAGWHTGELWPPSPGRSIACSVARGSVDHRCLVCVATLSSEDSSTL